MFPIFDRQNVLTISMSAKRCNLKFSTFLLLVIVLLGSTSCESMLGTGGPSEGAIEFKITYLDDEKSNPIISLLPNTMFLKFKDNNTVNKIEGFFGVFSLTYLVDNNKQINYTLVKIVDKKYMFEAKNSDPILGYNPITDLTIEHTTDTKMIAGYNCKKSIARYINDKGEKQEIDLFYTTEINIASPNTYNPFREINGVLLEFQVKMNNINMKFEAVGVQNIDIADEEFIIPPGFTKVNRDQMMETMNTYMPAK